MARTVCMRRFHPKRRVAWPRRSSGTTRLGTVRQRATQRGALPSVKHKEQERRKARALDGEQEAHLVALTCSAAPQGRKRWTLQLLKDRLIQMEVVENIGMETIRRTLKKTNSSRG